MYCVQAVSFLKPKPSLSFLGFSLVLLVPAVCWRAGRVHAAKPKLAVVV